MRTVSAAASQDAGLPSAPLNTALWTQCLNTMSGVQNSLVFCFALIRFLAEDDPDRRDFFRTLTIYALGYFLLAFYINTYQPISRRCPTAIGATC